VSTKYQKKQQTIVGIDYSLTSPAVCVTQDFKFENSYFYYLTSKKKYIGNMRKNIIGCEHKLWTDPIERFTQISDWVIDLLTHITPATPIDLTGPYKIFIEGYSFGSKGQAVFQIAENCGILKYRLQEKKYPYETVVPSVVKKGASGKGNADKQLMYESFTKHTGVDLLETFEAEKLNNPVTDIIDSYYIAKVGYENSSGH